MTDQTERCRRCGATGPGYYAHQIMVGMGDNPEVREEIIFICATCVAEDEAERQAEEAWMREDPEYAERVRKSSEEHDRIVHEQLKKAVTIN